MNNPKRETRATSRQGLRGESTSPTLLPKSSPQIKDHRSPIRRDTIDYDEKSSDEPNSDDEDVDEVDRCTPRKSPKLYPDISPFSSDSGSSPAWSPESKRSPRSPDESFLTARSHCIPRTGASGKKTGPQVELPVTPEKGSPGRKIYPDLRPMEPKKKKRVMNPLFTVGFVFLIILCIVTLYQSIENLDELQSTESFIKPIEEVYQNVKKELKVINNEFSQTKHFWVQLIGQLDTVMTDSPVQPAVILAVVPEGAEETAVCLLHKITQAVSDSFDDDRFIMYDVKSEVHKGRAHLKYDLHQALLKLEESHAAIVHNIENIPGQAAMTFHAFCDNENAPFKQALIILAINIPGKYEDLSWERLANTIDDYLLGIWGEELLQKDVSAVVSRVANAPVLIKPEGNSLIKTICPMK